MQMETSEEPRRVGKLDAQMADVQKGHIERVTHRGGTNNSQGAMSQPVEAARRSIAERQGMTLDSQSFDRFYEQLERPIDARFADFQRGRTRWDD